LDSLYPSCSRHFVQHADAEINVTQVALALCGMSILFFRRWLKEMSRKSKIARTQHDIGNSGSSTFMG